jgi:tyrosine-protein phosphatase SIW14
MQCTYMILVICVVLFGMSTDGVANPGGQLAVDDFDKLNDTYYRGGQPEREDYVRLAALGIKTVVDLRQGGTDDEQTLVENAGMKFYSFRMIASYPPSQITIQKFLEVVNDPANQPAFVHCQDGHIRTGVMTAVYRITHDGWTADQAYDEMKKYHFHSIWHHGLKRHHALKHFVYRYYDSIHSRELVAKTVS